MLSREALRSKGRGVMRDLISSTCEHGLCRSDCDICSAAILRYAHFMGQSKPAVSKKKKATTKREKVGTLQETNVAQQVKSHKVDQMCGDSTDAKDISEAGYLQEGGWKRLLCGSTSLLAEQDFIPANTAWGLMHPFMPEQPLHAAAPGDVPALETVLSEVEGLTSAAANKGGPRYVYAPRLGICAPYVTRVGDAQAPAAP